MFLIKDLGIRDMGTYKVRFGLYECPGCYMEFEARTTTVKSGRTTQCRKCGSSKHGLSSERIYRIYTDIKSRCENKKNKHYMDYGGRGIENKFEDFESFANWSYKNGYEEHLKIDRADNNGNYEPSNCRWTTQSIQSRNTRVLNKNNISGYRGVCKKKKDRNFTVSIVVDNKSIHIGMYKNAIDGAIAYNKYIDDNSLEHTKNIIPEKRELSEADLIDDLIEDKK